MSSETKGGWKKVEGGKKGKGGGDEDEKSQGRESGHKDDEKGRKTVLFILNRNGYDEDGLREVISLVLDVKFSIPDVKVLWVSIFGKPPDRPHALITLDNEDAARELCDVAKIHFDTDEVSLLFEISQAQGTPASGDSMDPLAIFVTGIPTTGTEVSVRERLSAFFGSVATPSKVILPKSWREKQQAILQFSCVQDAQMVMRCCAFCEFEGKKMKCSYAFKRE
jgi:hypothetical protein